MKIAVTGATGLIGSALVPALEAAGHEAVRLVRATPSRPGDIFWDPAAGTLDPGDLTGVDAVVHLAGAGIGDKRWTDERRALILRSRTESTSLLAGAMASCADGPRVLLSGSAIGFYGDRGDEQLDERSAAGSGFAAEVCVAWEGSAAAAVDAGIRTALLRTGIVLAGRGGALGKMLPPFRLGLGGPMGSGRQWMSWISLTDEVRAIIHLLDSDVAGPVNLTAPAAVTNRDFAKELGAALHRPAAIPLPAAAPRLLMGRALADELLFASQRVLPTVLLADGFEFSHPTLGQALASVL